MDDVVVAAAVEPETIDFGRVLVGGEAERLVLVVNTGRAPLRVLGAEAGSGFAAEISERLLEPLEHVAVSVLFTPTSAIPARAVLLVRTEATDLLVQLAGVGVLPAPPPPPIPRLACTPYALSWGPREVGTISTLTVACRNVGGGQLNLIRAFVSGDAEFHAAAEGLVISVVYGPLDTDTDSATLRVQSDGGTATIALYGWGVQLPCTRPQVDVFTGDARQVDALFVVDNSGSMYEEHAALIDGASDIIAAADESGVDYQIGVTTTGIRPSGSCPGGADGGEAGRLFPVHRLWPHLVTPATPSREFVLALNFQVGLCHSDEHGLEAMRLATSEPLLSAENAGFFRPDARLAVVIVSDEDDFSSRPVADYVEHLRGLERKVTVIAVVGHGCWTAQTGWRYLELAEQLEGLAIDLCAPDWHQVVSAIAGGVFLGRSEFQLSAEPVGAIVVHVGGRELPEFLHDGSRAWSSAAGVVTLERATAARVEISYRVPCEQGSGPVSDP